MKILIVDDEKNIRDSIAELLELEGYSTERAENGLSARKKLTENYFDAAVIDLKMPGMNGIELLQWLANEGPDPAVLMISAHGDIDDAVQAMKLGAVDYLVKPFDPDELLIRLKNALEHRKLREQVTAAVSGKQQHAGAESVSPAMKEVMRIAKKAAGSDTTILITGESGTGKEVLARQIHNISTREKGPFIPVNTGSLPETLLESELFGYEKGAFTGADKRKQGLFEAASGGTIFLDEIGEMPLSLQVKLLRVLQERKIQHLGGTGEIPVDVRILAATNKDLEKQIQAGAFREDLYYRLNVIHLQLPPLRERLEDLPALCAHFIAKHGSKGGVTGISAEAMGLLTAYQYPGNIRELENLLERAVILSEGEEIKAFDLNIKAEQKSVPPSGTLAEIEKQAIIQTLHRNEGKRQKSADELGISRRTLLNKMNEYRISGF